MAAVENGNQQQNICSPVTTTSNSSEKGPVVVNNNNGTFNRREVPPGGKSTSTTNNDDIEMDISEEMEEIREAVYDLLSNYPNGVNINHLEKLYNEKYVETKNAPKLPDNWLNQIKLADEFEFKQVGPISIIYQRQKHVPSVDGITKPKSSQNSFDIIVSNKDEVDHELEKKINAITVEDLKKKPSVTTTPPIPKPILKPLTTLSLEGDEVNKLGYATYIDTNGDIAVKFLEKETSVLRLFKEMNTFYIKNVKEYGPLDRKDIILNDYVAFFDRLHKQTFRVQILEEPTEGGDTIKGRLIDHGMITTIKISALRKLADPFKISSILPYTNIIEFSKKHQNIPKGFYNSLITRGEQMNTPVLIRINIENNEFFTKHNLPLKPSNATDDCTVTLPITTPSLIAHSTDLHSEPDRSTGSGRSTPLIGNYKNLFDTCPMKPFDLDKVPNEKFYAKLLVFKDPYNITFRLQSMEPIYNYMQDNLSRQSSSQSSPPPSGELKAGVLLAASMGPNNWQRVILIKQVLPTNHTGGTHQYATWLVFALDLGIQTTVQERNLRQLSPSTIAVDKMLCFRAKLHNIRPVQEAQVSTKGGEVVNKKVWNRDDLKPLKTLLFNINSEISEDGSKNISNSGYTVFSLAPQGPWTTYKKEDAPSLPFVSASISFNGTDLGQYLVEQGLAEWATTPDNKK
uniref:Protein kinase domain-containing protein n=1 Tax=Parastrongyloides trichosuri TaxID=131310 RepID=A0A0N4ZWQ8_PARTI